MYNNNNNKFRIGKLVNEIDDDLAYHVIEDDQSIMGKIEELMFEKDIEGNTPIHLAAKRV